MSELVSISESYAFCKQITKANATSFYFASKFLDKNKRKAAFAIYAYCRFADSLADEPRYKTKKKITENLKTFQKVTKRGIEKKDYQKFLTKLHPEDKKDTLRIFPAFLDTVNKCLINPKWFYDLLLGVEMDLSKTRYKDLKELKLYCYRVAGTVGLIMTDLIGYTDERVIKHAKNMGIALQLTNILRDVGEDLFERNRIYLPETDLKKYKVTEESLKQKKINPEFIELIKNYIKITKKMYRDNWVGFEYLNPEGLFGLKSACLIYSKILDKIEKNNYNVLTKRAYTRKREKILEVAKLLAKKKV